jgi:regulator of protease activity HflC (stomatin/prohibitin superfamily)
MPWWARYSTSLDAGFHILIPWLDAMRYRYSLKEQAVGIPEQTCSTRDNVQVDYPRRQHHSLMAPAGRQALPRWVLVDYYAIGDILERLLGRRAVWVVKRLSSLMNHYLDERGQTS